MSIIESQLGETYHRHRRVSIGNRGGKDRCDGLSVRHVDIYTDRILIGINERLVGIRIN
jgi:hypothetical protein